MFRTVVRNSVIAAALCAGVLAPAIPASAHEDGSAAGPTQSRLTGHQLAVIRDVTRNLRTPAAAIRAGYLPTETCVELPGVGGMGYHYVNPAFASDDIIDPVKPEILVFVPGEDGELRLGAAEYFKADADQDVTTTTDRPTLFGHEFEGPMLGHEPGMPIHYDLHVWLYKNNPAGQLAVWNPRVHCPAA